MNLFQPGKASVNNGDSTGVVGDNGEALHLFVVVRANPPTRDWIYLIQRSLIHFQDDGNSTVAPVMLGRVEPSVLA